MVDGVFADDSSAMAADDQERELARLNAEIERLEQVEENLIESAFGLNVDILRRPYASPPAVLGVKLRVIAPAERPSRRARDTRRGLLERFCTGDTSARRPDPRRPPPQPDASAIAAPPRARRLRGLRPRCARAADADIGGGGIAVFARAPLGAKSSTCAVIECRRRGRAASCALSASMSPLSVSLWAIASRCAAWRAVTSADSVGRTVVTRGGFGASSGRRTRARPSFPCVFDQRPRNARALAARTVTCSRSATSSYVSHSSSCCC